MKIDALDTLEELSKQVGSLENAMSKTIAEFKQQHFEGSPELQKMQDEVDDMVKEMKTGNPSEIADKYLQKWHLK